MKNFLYGLSLAVLASCSSFKPVEDRTLPPARNGVYTVETWACGVPFMGTSGCLLTNTDDLTKKFIKIVIPTTSKKEYSQLQVLSPNCQVSFEQSVKSGEEVTLSLKQILGTRRLSQNCNLDIVVSPKWENQDQFTIPVYPLIGRVLVVLSDNPPTQLSPVPAYPVALSGGFIRIVMQKAVSRTTSFVVNTKGSKAGRVVLTGCNMLTFDYRTENPEIIVPFASESCKFFGTVLRLDVKGDLAFFGQIDYLPPRYTFLTSPSLRSEDGKRILRLDPLAPIASIDGEIMFGNSFDLTRSEYLQGEHYLRQITTNGRQSLSLIKNGAIKWTIQ